MPKFVVRFYGRKIGAIGLSRLVAAIEVSATTRQLALQVAYDTDRYKRLYDTYEHVQVTDILDIA